MAVHTHTHTQANLTNKESKNYKEKNKKNKAITLISLVITIVIMLILAGVTINIGINADGLFARVNEGTFKTDLGNMKEELSIYIYNKKLFSIGFDESKLNAGESNITYEGKQIDEGKTVYDILPTAKKYEGSFEIIAGTIYYRGTKEEQINWAREMDILYNPFIIVDGELQSANDNLKLVEEDGSITIPPNVTSIAEGAFNNVVGLKNITIPGTVKEIGKNTFSNNQTLEKVILEEGVQSIGDSAFRSCRNLKEVQMADSITQMGRRSI